MLDPSTRMLYTEALTPPPGLIFQEAIATTFSMSPEILLEAPVHLSFMTSQGASERDQLAILESIRRYSEKITVYVAQGYIQVPHGKKPSVIMGLLEDMIVEVAAPRGGVFHPKVWAIHFTSPDGQCSVYRLVVLSRNMTHDHAWDLSLQLEGQIDPDNNTDHPALGSLFHFLARQSSGDRVNATTNKDTHVSQKRKNHIERAQRFAQNLPRVRWRLPQGFEKIRFYTPGVAEFDLQFFQKAKRLAVISPFCSDEALRQMVGGRKQYAAAPDVLVSRPEALEQLTTETRALFECKHLNEGVEHDLVEPESAGATTTGMGLHAKAYLYECFNDAPKTHLLLGSANATNAALLATKNIEILVELIGPAKEVGGIDSILGPEGMGQYLVAFDSSIECSYEEQSQETAKILEQVRRQIAQAGLWASCELSDDDRMRKLILHGLIPGLDEVDCIYLWPITRSGKAGIRLVAQDNHSARRMEIAELSVAEVTGLVAFEVQLGDNQLSFVLNLPLENAPQDRIAEIMRILINNEESFFRYLFLLLGHTQQLTSEGGARLSFLQRLAQHQQGIEAGVLEELVRTYSRTPAELKNIAKMIEQLTTDDTQKIIPKRFRELWRIFTQAMKEEHE